MAIKIENDRICIGNFILCEDGNGVVFDGTACANEFPKIGFRGTLAGYKTGGGGTVDDIDKFPFATETYSTNIACLTCGRGNHGSQSSAVSGYASVGNVPTPGQVPPNLINIVDKFPFAADANATDVGDLSRTGVGDGHSSISQGFGYMSFSDDASSNRIGCYDKFPFAADTNGTSVGSLAQERGCQASQSSNISGYNSGGAWDGNPLANPAASRVGNIFRDAIDKFPFATDANSTDVGELAVCRYGASGLSSDEFGYSAGGGFFRPWPTGNPVGNTSGTLQKFPFASDTSSTSAGGVEAHQNAATSSSVSSGYMSGGLFNNGPTCTIGLTQFSKIDFANDAPSTDIGELGTPITGMAGNQI